jgi:Bacterial Ig domain
MHVRPSSERRVARSTNRPRPTGPSSADGNAGLIAPSLMDFDLQTGTVVGTACPNCTIEVFSDDDDEATSYEGRGVADGAGIFALEVGRPLAGPNLTAVATDAEGNTSPPSQPTSGDAQRAILQEGNERPRTAISITDHSELEGTHTGDMWDMDRSEPPCPAAREHW